MKNAKKLLLISAAALGVVGLAACGNNSTGGGDSSSGGAASSGDGSTFPGQSLSIFCTGAGYGTDWLAPMIENFKNQEWVKAKYPGLTVSEPEISKNQGYVQDLCIAGEDAFEYDLYFGMNLHSNYGDGYFADLTTDLYESEVPDAKGGLYKDRMNSSYLESLKYSAPTNPEFDGKYFSCPWAGGNVSLMYNPSLLADAGISEAPRTTDELLNACKVYTAKHYGVDKDRTTTYAFMKANDEDYVNKLFYIWWAQYQTKEGVDDFYSGVDDGSLSKDIFKQQGRLKALSVIENFFKSTKHYVHPNSKINGYLDNQAAFKGGSALFYACGDWYPTEMAEIEAVGLQSYDVSMMRAPILSSIIDKTPSIENDKELSKVIKAIDNESTELSGTGYNVTQEDYDIIKEARRIVYSFGSGHNAIVANNSSHKMVAIDFLRYMASIDGQETYMKYTKGASLPFMYDVANENPDFFNSEYIDPMHKERLKYMNSSFINPYTLPSITDYDLVVYGEVREFANQIAELSLDYFATFSAANVKNSAQDYYDRTIAYWDEGTRWADALSKAGLQ